MPTEQEIEQTAENMSDIEIAQLANQEIRKRDEEIAKLRKDLAKSKLYYNADDEEQEHLTREECISRLADNGTTNYDYAEAVIGLVEAELEAGRPNPLGKRGDDVYNFLKDCIEECGDDKSRFVSIYQSKIGADSADIALAYNRRK